MPRVRGAQLAIVLIALLGAVGLTSSACADADAYPEDYFLLPAAPLNVTAIGDEAHRASATIGEAGGTVKATAGDGTMFELLIPPEALDEDVQISLTPIARLEGGPEPDSGLPGVIFSPDGLVFDKMAKLTIVGPKVASELVAGVVEGQGSGDDLILAPYERDGETLTLSVAHFTIFKVDSDALAKQAAKDLAKDPARRFQNALVGELDLSTPKTPEERKAQLETQRLQSLFVAYRKAISMSANEVSRDPAGGCDDLRYGLNGYLEAFTKFDPTPDRPADWLPSFAELSNTLRSVLVSTCRVEAERRCSVLMDDQSINDQATAESTLQGADLAEITAWRKAARVKCFTFDVVIETHQAAKYVDLAGCPTKSDVVLKAHIRTSGTGKRRDRLSVGAEFAAPVSFEIGINCGLDKIKPIELIAKKPMGVSVAPPWFRSPEQVMELRLDPGDVTMAYDVDGYPMDDTETWLKGFNAYMATYKRGNLFRFYLQRTGSDRGSYAGTFTGTGSREEYGTWTGTETIKITVTRAGK